MKDLNEYKEEIFRRSETKIKARKRDRIRLIALCIPLVLCIGLIALVPMFDVTSDGDVMDGGMVALPVAYVTVEGSSDGDDYDFNVRDVVIAANIYDALITRMNYSGNDQFTAGDDLDSGADWSDVNLVITVVFQNGGDKVFTVEGSELTDNSTGDGVSLSEGSLEQLLELIGACE